MKYKVLTYNELLTNDELNKALWEFEEKPTGNQLRILRAHVCHPELADGIEAFGYSLERPKEVYVLVDKEWIIIKKNG